jgi:hypothetical protein
VHLWEQVSFTSNHPTQLIAGFSGTMEDTVPIPAVLPTGATPAPGAVVASASSWVDGFGYMTLERRGDKSWDVRIWNTQGKQVNFCQIVDKKSHCDISKIK